MARKNNGVRDNDKVSGWDVYFRIACSIALRYLSFYFPTREDLVQSAALAASAAAAGLGNNTTLGELTPVLRRELKREASHYGMRQRQVVKTNGHKSMQTIKADYPFADYRQGDDGKPGGYRELSDTRFQLIGVSDWTRRMSKLLSEL